jgi:hypothetical protein
MKKVAVTVAVLALGLAACQPKSDANNTADTNVENAATNDVTAGNEATTNADNALNTTDTNATDANATDNAAANTTNAQ